MPFYRSMGNLPPKRHTQFRRPDGGLYSEEVMGTEGFSGIQSILYHKNPPTGVQRVAPHSEVRIDFVADERYHHRHFLTAPLPAKGDPISGRVALMGNDDVTFSMCRPAESMHYFYRNGENYELLFIHEGSGRIESTFGTLRFRPGDYVVIPVATTYRIVADPGELRFLVFETHGMIEYPSRYRNEYGQLLEHSPYCERDIRGPEELATFAEEGEFEVRTKARGRLTSYFYHFHPLDVVGWDGYLYPWALSIHDFEPITGRIHMPPPAHQTFKGPGFVICSFVPRLFDYHPLAIPVPYNHANVHSDEVLYYVKGNFMSRRGVEVGSITLHPGGVIHGPHPGAVEGSLGKQGTDELAVMMDTFRPLRLTRAAIGLEDERYVRSWVSHS